MLVAALLLSLLPAPSSLRDTIPVTELTRAPMLDGRADFREYGVPSVEIPTAAGSVSVWVARAGGYLYIAASLPDSTFYWGDDLVISLDANGSGGAAPGEGDRQWYLRRLLDSSVVSLATNGRWQTPGQPETVLGSTRHHADWDVASASGSAGWSLELRIREQLFSGTPRLAFRTYNNAPQGWWSSPTPPTGTPAQRVERNPDLWIPLRLAGATTGASVQSCSGTAARSGYAMTYHGDRHEVVIFGGETPNDALSADSWSWNGQRWECLAGGTATGPRARNAAMLAYDEKRHVLVLYGGRVGREGLRDTWELGASGWLLKDSAGPTPDPHGVMAWSAASDGVLLYHSLGDDTPARATWRWDGARWSKLADGPDQQFPDALFASTAGDPATLLTAKSTGVRDAFAAILYRWQENHWSLVPTSGTIPVFSPQAPAARTATGALLFAGFEADRSVTSYALEGTSWRKVDGISPSRRKGAQMVYDPSRRVAVLHAGDDGERVLGDTWEWDGSNWSRVHQ